MTRKIRGRGEGSIFPYRSGFAAYSWVETPDGERRRKYVYGKTREEVHDKWISLQKKAKEGPLATKVPTLGAYLRYWLREVVEPGMKPKPAETYGMHVRLYISPGLGDKRLDRIRVPDVRRWLNSLSSACQCCVQGKDARRAPGSRKCCAVGRCCGQRLSRTTIESTRAVLRRALNNAMAEELITKNPVELVQVPSAASRRKRQIKPWSVEEARRFLVAARSAQDPLYAAYTLILVTGLRRGEVLGLTWDRVELDGQELLPSMALQRVNRRLVLDEAKTDAWEEPVPLPEICTAALRLRAASQASDRKRLEGSWPDPHGLVFTSRYGRPIEPRNFNRSFTNRCAAAGVRAIRLHDTRHTCGSLLAALDVHPRVAMQILRHSKIDVTMEIYTHVPSELTRAALKKLADSLGAEEELS